MIERKPLRAQVQKEILAQIADQRLPAGTRINESHLSADLGISRTPLREAMLGLEAAGFLHSDLGRGFLVPPVTGEEFCQMQIMLSRLAPFALTQSGPLPGSRIMELNNLLGRSRVRVARQAPEQAAAVAELVGRWSHLCVSPCPNGLLVADINRLEALSRRGWQEAVQRGFAPDAMLASFDRLYELLRNSQTDAAVAHWEDHLVRYGNDAALHLPQTP